MRRAIVAGVLCLCAVVPAARMAGAQEEPNRTADLVVTGARVWTGATGQPEAQAVAIRGGKYVAVGSDADIKRLIGPKTRVIEARGRRVIPGLIDSHLHIISGGLQMGRLSLREASNREQFTRLVGKRARELGDGEWVLGGRWTVDSWADPTPPGKEWIDAATSDNPVFLSRMDGHMGLANTVALKLAGITRDGPPDPEGGRIDRDAKTGEPTGLLRDAAMDLVTRHIPAPEEPQLDEALLRAMRHANRWGLTLVHSLSHDREIGTMARAMSKGKLSLRIYSFFSTTNWRSADRRLNLLSWHGSDFLKIGGFKGFMDGSLGSRTAYMAEPFADNAPERKDWRGLLNAMADPPSEMARRCLFADKHGRQTAIHAIGDQANHLLLDIYEKVRRTNGARDRRHRIEHAQHILPADIARFAELDVIASMQPLHKADDGRYAEQAIGSHRLQGSYAFGSLLKSGATVCFGSDWPVVSLNPFEGMAVAVTGRTNDGKVWISQENITIEQALRCYTTNGARACFMEDRLGTIEPGKLADLVILDSDLLSIQPDQIAEVQPVLTVVAGRVVYSSDDD